MSKQKLRLQMFFSKYQTEQMWNSKCFVLLKLDSAIKCKNKSQTWRVEWLQRNDRFVPISAANPWWGLHGPAAALWASCECLQQMFVFCGAVHSSVFLLKSFIISNVFRCHFSSVGLLNKDLHFALRGHFSD